MQENFDWDSIWDSIKDAMRNGVVEVTFIKADKTTRVMQCTLAEYLLPETSGKPATSSGNPDIVVVYDLEKEAWRSFKKSTVTEVTIYG